MGLKPGDEVLIPAYHHGSEVEALLRAGVTCRFYDVSETLEPDERELEARSGSRTRALYLIHYFGFPQDVVRWRAWCDERGLLLFEDVALAWLGSAGDKPLGSFGDVSIFCLYKTLGLPDGGALAMRSHSAQRDGPRRVGLRQLLFLHARWLESRNRLAARVNATVAPLASDEPVADASQEFVLDARGELPTAATTFALPRLADAAIAARRRANYQILLEELLELVRVRSQRCPPARRRSSFRSCTIVPTRSSPACDEKGSRRVAFGARCTQHSRTRTSRTQVPGDRG